MKTLILLIAVLLPLPSHSSIPHTHTSPHHHADNDDTSVHGMFVFGTTTIYLNHLAMFMHPHDEQAIFEATFDDGGAYAKATSGLVTLVPEPMSLTELIAEPHDFFGDLYDGHFERGGKKIASHIRVTVTQVVHAHKIGAAVPAADIAFGNCQAHFITKAPDFDEIWCDGKKIYREDADLQ